MASSQRARKRWVPAGAALVVILLAGPAASPAIAHDDMLPVPAATTAIDQGHVHSDAPTGHSNEHQHGIAPTPGSAGTPASQNGSTSPPRDADTSRPQDASTSRPQNVVFGSFAAVNAGVLLAAALTRRSSRRSAARAASSASRPIPRGRNRR